MFRFEKLEVWQKVVEFADRVYEVGRGFPDRERFGLTGQTRRVAVSVSSSIAEGNGRSAGKDFARFVEIAYSSLMEVVSQMQVAVRQSFLQTEMRHELYQRAEEPTRMLSGLRSSLLHARSCSGS